MAKQQKEELPLMEDFTEDSLFDQLEEEENDEGAEGSGNENDDDDDDDSKAKAKAKQDEEDSDSDDDEDDQEDDDSKTSKKAKPKSKKTEDDDGDDEDENEDDDSSEETFWSDVEKLTGRNVEAEYGDTDPESAEGAAIREEALVQSAINDHLDYLSKIYPREFRALEHAANGGKMEDLYNPAEPDYSKMEISKDDGDSQKVFMSNYYQKKGFSVSKSNRMVEADEDSDEGLYKTASDALKELSTSQEKDRTKIAKDQAATDGQNRKQDMQMVGAVEQVVQKGKLERFTIPVKEKEEFYQFALQHMQRNPQGGYMFVQPVQPRDLERQLQEMYFTYKGGDLSKIVQREVKTEGAKRLKRNAAKSSNKKTGAGSDDSRKQRKGALPTMEDYNV